MKPTRPSPSCPRVLCLLGVALAAAGFALEASAARLALVVGNDKYQHVSPLRNARNDAQSLARELEAAGFKVTRVLDATREAMHDSIDGFLRRVEKGDEVVFFFSGHGSQPPQLGPYLLPVDIKVTGERAIQRDGISLEQMVDDLNQRARFSLIIIDACRDDPFRQTTAGRSLPAGSALGRIEPPKGSMIIMAASKGQQALDRLSNNDPVPNGLFTRELVKQMRTPGLSAADMLKRVRSSVETTASSVNHAQRPSLVDESSTDFFFYPPVAGGAVAPPPPPVLAAPSGTGPSAKPATNAAAGGGSTPTAPVVKVEPAATPAPMPAAVNTLQAEFEIYDRAANSRQRADYETYLRLYPNGRYVDRAREALKKL
jgi:uncharacterized caspase-like protein